MSDQLRNKDASVKSSLTVGGGRCVTAWSHRGKTHTDLASITGTVWPHPLHWLVFRKQIPPKPTHLPQCTTIVRYIKIQTLDIQTVQDIMHSVKSTDYKETDKATEVSTMRPSAKQVQYSQCPLDAGSDWLLIKNPHFLSLNTQFIHFSILWTNLFVHFLFITFVAKRCRLNTQWIQRPTHAGNTVNKSRACPTASDRECYAGHVTAPSLLLPLAGASRWFLIQQTPGHTLHVISPFYSTSHQIKQSSKLSQYFPVYLQCR